MHSTHLVCFLVTSVLHFLYFRLLVVWVKVYLSRLGSGYFYLYLIRIATNTVLDCNLLFLYFRITTVSFCIDFVSRDYFGSH